MNRFRLHPFHAVLAVVLFASACAGGVQKEASYPDRKRGSDKIVYSDQKRTTIWGEGETLSSRFFGDKNDESANSGIGVNSFLWRSALDTVAFMPVASADPFGGVILTDWYENPDSPSERFKLNVYILDRQLRSDGVRVSVFRQVRRPDGWKDSAVSADTTTNIENAILTRARELRVAQAGRDKN